MGLVSLSSASRAPSRNVGSPSEVSACPTSAPNLGGPSVVRRTRDRPGRSVRTALALRRACERRTECEHQAGRRWCCSPVLLQRTPGSVRSSTGSPCKEREGDEAWSLGSVPTHTLRPLYGCPNAALEHYTRTPSSQATPSPERAARNPPQTRKRARSSSRARPAGRPAPPCDWDSRPRRAGDPGRRASGADGANPDVAPIMLQDHARGNPRYCARAA